jgi:hypothetical protein
VFAVIPFAPVVSHAFDPRRRKNPGNPAALKAARTILTGFWRVKKPNLRHKRLKTGDNVGNFHGGTRPANAFCVQMREPRRTPYSRHCRGGTVADEMTCGRRR